jgi:uncharacterized protein YndB with AHSA1/START domain
MTRNLSFKRHLRHSPERVWKALTDKNALSQWYMDNDFSPVVGHQFTFRPTPKMNFDGLLCGVVIKVDEPYLLMYSFRGGSMTGETVVTWTLIPDGTGTLLLLEHTGFNVPDDITLNSIMTICPSRFLPQLADSLDTTLLAEI